MPDMGWVPAVVGLCLTLLHITVCVLAIGVIPGGRKPSTGMAWLILILAVPYFGVLAFLLFGSTSVGRGRREQQRRVNEQVAAALDVSEAGIPEEGTLAGAVRLNQQLGSLPMTKGNQVRIQADYRESIEEMRREVERASRFVHVEFYITGWDDVTGGFFEALVAATQRGVKVRLLFDHLGSRGIPGYQDMLGRLRETDIEWASMLPIDPLHGKVRRPDLRNHRKILVVDGRVAFTGSQNLIEAGYDKPKNHEVGREWVDLMVRVEGPVVRDLGVVFATDWFIETGENLRELVAGDPPTPTMPPGPGVVSDTSIQVVPSGPGFVTENNLRLFNTLIYSANRRLSLTSPYFVPDESLLYAVTTAAQRGVEVELFVNEGADQFMVFHAQRSYYTALLEAGIRIWLYPEPYVLHSKFFTVDDDLAVIGTSNMDYRSFALNYEVVLFLRGEGVVDGLGEVQDLYRSKSRELTMESWRRRSRGAAYVDNVMRLTAALQ
jgi:cardiolipin synthase A/B